MALWIRMLLAAATAAPMAVRSPRTATASPVAVASPAPVAPVAAPAVAPGRAAQPWPWAGMPSFSVGRPWVLATGQAALELGAATGLDLSGGLAARHRGAARGAVGLGHGVEAAVTAGTAQMGLAGSLRPSQDGIGLRWRTGGPRLPPWAPTLGAALALVARGPPRLALRLELAPAAAAAAGQALIWAELARDLAGHERSQDYAAGAGLASVLPGSAAALAATGEAWLTATDRAGRRGHLVVLAPRLAAGLLWRPAAEVVCRVALAVGPDVRRDDEAQVARLVLAPALTIAWRR